MNVLGDFQTPPQLAQIVLAACRLLDAMGWTAIAPLQEARVS